MLTGREGMWIWSEKEGISYTFHIPRKHRFRCRNRSLDNWYWVARWPSRWTIHWASECVLNLLSAQVMWVEAMGLDELSHQCALRNISRPRVTAGPTLTSFMDRLLWSSFSPLTKCTLFSLWLHSPTNISFSALRKSAMSFHLHGSFLFFHLYYFWKKAVWNLSSSEVAPGPFCHKDTHTEYSRGSLQEKKRQRRTRAALCARTWPFYAFKGATIARTSLPHLSCSEEMFLIQTQKITPGLCIKYSWLPFNPRGTSTAADCA